MTPLVLKVPRCKFCGEEKTKNTEGGFLHCVDCDALGRGGIAKRGSVEVYRRV